MHKLRSKNIDNWHFSHFILIPLENLRAGHSNKMTFVRTRKNKVENVKKHQWIYLKINTQNFKIKSFLFALPDTR